MTATQIADANFLVSFLAAPDIVDLSSERVDVIVICASELLFQATHLFELLVSNPTITKSLVLCGGQGHSTERIYRAVAQHPTFRSVAEEIKGLPEAQVLRRLLDRFYDVSRIENGGCRILVEDKSTNCGSNALFSRRLLDDSGFVNPSRLVVVQDPTMALRTVASFRRAYGNSQHPPTILSYPVFVPEVAFDTSVSQAGAPMTTKHAAWEWDRFLELVLGEIPRLRDDVMGYGPRGKNYIDHVDIPAQVEEVWARLSGTVSTLR